MKNWQTRLSVKPETNEMKIVGKGAMVCDIPTYDEPKNAESVHPLLEGSISDSFATREALEPYYNELLKKLANLEEALIETKSPKFDKFKPEVADMERFEVLKPALDEIDKTIDERFKQAAKGVSFAENIAQAARELVEPEDEITALRADLNSKEIRDAVNSMSPTERKEFIDNAVNRQDMFTLNALSKSYLPVIKSDPRYVDKAIDHVVSKRFPFVPDMVDNFTGIMKAVQTRTSEFQIKKYRLFSKYGLDLEKLERGARTTA